LIYLGEVAKKKKEIAKLEREKEEIEQHSFKP